MREIFFRGKRIDNGEWIYGFYYEANDIITDKILYHILDLDSTFYPHEGVAGWDVITETVGQYTGLTDKNGTKIFEGDVCKAYICKAADTVEKEVVGVICFEDGTFEFKCEHENIYLYPLIDVLEVIGNVHDDVNLLEVENNG